MMKSFDPGKILLKDALEALRKGAMTPENAFAAVSFVELGADEPEAHLELACMYRDGTGCTADTAKAVEHLRRSAQLGNALAQYHMGHLMYHGALDEADMAEGMEWMGKAAAQGCAEAAAFLEAVSH